MSSRPADPPAIAYSSPDIEEYYRHHRIKWGNFYQSEQVIFTMVGLGPASRVLDVGCGCGGLGLALAERFGVRDYVGVEINEQAAATGRLMNPKAYIVAADLGTLEDPRIPPGSFDAVVSLSCIDWNLGFERTLPKAYDYVKPGGSLISSFRVTDRESADDIGRSYQYVNFTGEKRGSEMAPYVVLNHRVLLERLTRLYPSAIRGYGYWGKPSGSAVTPFDRICFCVFAVGKPVGAPPASPRIELQLPADLLGK